MFYSTDEIISLLQSYGLYGEVAMARKAGRERLSILKFTKKTEKWMAFTDGKQVRQPLFSPGQTKMRIAESSKSHFRLAWNSHALSCALIEFKPAQIFLESHRRLSRSRLARGDDSQWELKKTLMIANSQQLSSLFVLGFTSSSHQRLFKLALFW